MENSLCEPVYNQCFTTCLLENLVDYNTNMKGYSDILYLAEVFHFVQHFVYFWNNIFPIHKYWHIGTISQSDMKHSSVLKQEEEGKTWVICDLHFTQKVVQS